MCTWLPHRFPVDVLRSPWAFCRIVCWFIGFLFFHLVEDNHRRFKQWLQLLCKSSSQTWECPYSLFCRLMWAEFTHALSCSNEPKVKLSLSVRLISLGTTQRWWRLCSVLLLACLPLCTKPWAEKQAGMQALFFSPKGYTVWIRIANMLNFHISIQPLRRVVVVSFPLLSLHTEGADELSQLLLHRAASPAASHSQGTCKRAGILTAHPFLFWANDQCQY